MVNRRPLGVKSELLPTKLNIPDLRRNIVERRQVIRTLLDADDVNLILFQAPAGYGKTTVMAQLAHKMKADGVGVGWLSLDDRDGDFSLFIAYFEAALSKALGREDVLTDKNMEDTDSLITRYVHLLYEAEGDFALFLDNFEAAASVEIESFLRRLVKYLPYGKRLIIGSRTTSDMKLSELHLSGRLSVISTEELRFRFIETREFFNPDYGLDDEDVRQLQNRTDGWPAAMQFVALSFSKRKDRRSYARSFSTLTPELSDYLAADVFLHQSEDIRDFLLKSSILSVLSPELCVAVTGREDSRQMLEFLEKAGLFLEYVEYNPPWYKYHSLFGEFLGREFMRQKPDVKIECHKIAAQWYEQNERYEEAISHYGACGNEEKVADLIEAHIQKLVFEERLGMVIRWTEMLPRDMLDKREEIKSAAIIAYAFRRDFKKARDILESYKDNTIDAPLALRSRHKNLELFLLAAEDKMEEMGATAEESLEEIPQDMSFEYGIHLNAYAYWLHAKNRFDKAHNALIKAHVAHDSIGDLFGRAYQEGIDGAIAMAQGELQLAIKRLRKGLKHAERNLPPGSSAGGFIAAHLGEALYEAGETTRAKELLEDYLPLIEKNTIADGVVVANVTLSRIMILEQDSDMALETLENLKLFGEKYGLKRITSDAHFEMIRIVTMARNFVRADILIDEMKSSDFFYHDGSDINYHSSDVESKSVAYARYLICRDRVAKARAILRKAINLAEKGGRVRRLIKLRIMNAFALKAAGEVSAAKRELLKALKLAQAGQFIRSFIDEGPEILTLLQGLHNDMSEETVLHLSEDIAVYISTLLIAAGQPVPNIEEDKGFFEEPLESLTDKEEEILSLLTIGKSNKAMALHLGVSDNTIKWHLRNVYEKLGVNNRTQAVTIGRKFGLLT
ncbi:MAG: hypothetical protein COB36_14740 [Alphaproteobacteria bacterium]|nr:MAG: hypothetical protein COB36_14740 [Alphaproteobacteria bacterium]